MTTNAIRFFSFHFTETKTPKTAHSKNNWKYKYIVRKFTEQSIIHATIGSTPT